MGLEFDHPDFLAAFSAAAKSNQAPKSHASGTIGSAWAAMEASDLFATGSQGHRAILRREGVKITEQTGAVKLAAVKAKHIRTNVSEASNKGGRLKAWRFFFKFCISKGWLETNPANAVVKPKMPPTKGHPTWSLDDIQTFRKHFPIGSTPRAVMELLYWSGARISDVVMLGPRNVGEDGILAFEQIKTKDMSYVPWDCALPDYGQYMQVDLNLCKEAIKACPKGFTFLGNPNGRTRSHKGAGTKAQAQ
ncbi:MAG: hypothetical protein ABJL99_09795 [Aliishimia sp.]